MTPPPVRTTDPRPGGAAPGAGPSSAAASEAACGATAPPGAERSPRILVVTPQPFYEDRGTPIALRYLLRALTELGYAVDLLVFPIGREIEIPGVRYHRSGNPLRFRSIPIGFSWKKLFLDLLLWRKLRSLLRSERYVRVHAVEEAAFLAAILCRGGGPPITYDMASSIPEQLLQYRLFRGRAIQALLRRVERWTLKNVDQVICSGGLEERIRALAPALDCQPWIFPAEFGATEPSAAASLRRRLCATDDEQIVLYAGSFSKYQGLDLLVDAIPAVLEAVPASRFVVIGAPDEDAAAAMLDSVPSPFRDRVHIVPRIAKESIPSYLYAADVLVSPRSHGHNLPLKIFDYLQSGRAIVATDIPAHRSVLDERVALLVEPTAAGLADGITTLLLEPALSKRLAASAKRYAESRFGWPNFVTMIAKLVRPARVGAVEHPAPATP